MSISTAELKQLLKQAPLSLLLSEIQRRFEELNNKIPSEDPNAERWYSVPEVATLCEVKVSTVQRWVRTNTYPAKKMGRSYFFSSDTFAEIRSERGLTKS